jgi:hypothetical protein
MFKKITPVVYRGSARHRNFDSYNFRLHVFGGVHLLDRLGITLPWVSSFLPNSPLSFPSSLSITIHLWQPRIPYPEKEEDIYTNKAKAKTEYSSHKTLGFPTLSRDWHRTSFWHKTAWSSSDCYGINSHGLNPFTPRAISTWTTSDCHGDHNSRLPRLIHSLDHG